jgi:hypothetical protein
MTAASSAYHRGQTLTKYSKKEFLRKGREIQNEKK